MKRNNNPGRLKKMDPGKVNAEKSGIASLIRVFTPTKSDGRGEKGPFTVIYSRQKKGKSSHHSI